MDTTVTGEYIIDSGGYINDIEQSKTLKDLWTDYQKKHEFAKGIDFEDTVKAVKVIRELLHPLAVS